MINSALPLLPSKHDTLVTSAVTVNSSGSVIVYSTEASHSNASITVDV